MEETESTSAGFDPLLLAVLSNRMQSIVREMSNIVKKASRSTAITNARDFSCGLLTFDHRLVCVEEAMPVHVTAMDLSTRPITDLFGDVTEGDAFFSNSPYHGGTHHADMTLCVPVHLDGVPMFWTVARSHHADTGAHVPTTMDAYMRNVYEEGMHIPVVRFQSQYRDREDVIRWCRHNIRESHIWYGDYQAQVGATRTAETRLKELGARYGRETILAFIDAWMEYGRRRARATIAALPAGTLSWTCRHDPVPGVADEGVAITAKVTIQPEAGKIVVDLRDNPDCVAGGINLSEACATGAGRIGVFYNLDPSLPHNDGSASCIDVLLRDGCIVGRPSYPAGTSNATMGVNDRLINAFQCAFAQLGAPYGLAEGGTEFGANNALGMGEWNGAPAMQGVYRPLSQAMTVAYCSDGDVNPPRGVVGGLEGTRAINAKRLPDGSEIPLPAFHMETLNAGERIVFRTVSGGGYGPARDRDPARVARDADRGWIDADVARNVYGVVLAHASNGVDHIVDEEATARLRSARAGEAR